MNKLQRFTSIYPPRPARNRQLLRDLEERLKALGRTGHTNDPGSWRLREAGRDLETIQRDLYELPAATVSAALARLNKLVADLEKGDAVLQAAIEREEASNG